MAPATNVGAAAGRAVQRRRLREGRERRGGYMVSIAGLGTGTPSGRNRRSRCRARLGRRRCSLG
jgi:hypothetical protein